MSIATPIGNPITFPTSGATRPRIPRPEPTRTDPLKSLVDALVKVRSTLAESAWIPSPNRLVGTRARARTEV